MSERWNPWRALRARPQITLQVTWLRGARGLWVPHGDGTSTIHLDARLGRRERRCVLAHELIHEERGITYGPDTPHGLVQAEERAVDREAVRRLVPVDEMLALIQRCDTLEVWEVADEFDVDQRTARRACALVG